MKGAVVASADGAHFLKYPEGERLEKYLKEKVAGYGMRMPGYY
jgi:hypothetical protein